MFKVLALAFASMGVFAANEPKYLGWKIKTDAKLNPAFTDNDECRTYADRYGYLPRKHAFPGGGAYYYTSGCQAIGEKYHPGISGSAWGQELPENEQNNETIAKIKKIWAEKLPGSEWIVFARADVNLRITLTNRSGNGANGQVEWRSVEGKKGLVDYEGLETICPSKVENLQVMFKRFFGNMSESDQKKVRQLYNPEKTESIQITCLAKGYESPDGKEYIAENREEMLGLSFGLNCSGPENSCQKIFQ